MNWRNFFRSLYAMLFLFCGALFFFGRDYYLAPAFKKARHALNPILRQSGSTGHLLGIIGTFFMLLLLLYSIRKRFRFASGWGSLNVWLSAHIFLGIAGPALVLFHSAFKFSGIVSIAFWSMALVVASGVVGKYIFTLIPRSLSGMELNRIELEAEEIGLTFEMRKLLPAAHPFWQRLAAHRERGRAARRVWNICTCYLNPAQLRRQLRRLLGISSGLDRRQRKKLIALVVKRHMIHHKAQLLQQNTAHPPLLAPGPPALRDHHVPGPAHPRLLCPSAWGTYGNSERLPLHPGRHCRLAGRGRRPALRFQGNPQKAPGRRIGQAHHPRFLPDRRRHRNDPQPAPGRQKDVPGRQPRRLHRLRRLRAKLPRKRTCWPSSTASQPW